MTSPDSSHILSEFELSQGDGYHIFASECVRAAGRISAGYRISAYDHRSFLPCFSADSPFYLEQYRVGYACFKREVARVLQPKVIVEIGIGCGIGALAFLDGAPSAYYEGIDSDEGDFPATPKIIPTEYLEEILTCRSHPHRILRADSRHLQNIPRADLVHVDGDHSREAARHDVTLAWRSGAAWILCDDARDTSVCAGVFEALAIDLNRGSAEWAYFNDTWTGSILIRTDHKRIGE